MSKLVDISSDEFWQILFDEACVEGRQAERIEAELGNICVDENEIRNKVIDEAIDKFLEYGCVCVEWNKGLSKERLVDDVLKQAMGQVVYILEKMKKG